jgi:hypothetical protein
MLVGYESSCICQHSPRPWLGRMLHRLAVCDTILGQLDLICPPLTSLAVQSHVRTPYNGCNPPQMRR